MEYKIYNASLQISKPPYEINNDDMKKDINLFQNEWNNKNEIKDYDEKKDKYKILYFEERWSDDTKKKRTAIWLDKTEFFNFSQTTEKDLKYYLNDRRERENYLDMLPKVKLAYKYFKTKAYEREDYFREHFAE